MDRPLLRAATKREPKPSSVVFQLPKHAGEQLFNRHSTRVLVCAPSSWPHSLVAPLLSDVAQECAQLLTCALVGAAPLSVLAAIKQACMHVISPP